MAKPKAETQLSSPVRYLKIDWEKLKALLQELGVKYPIEISDKRFAYDDLNEFVRKADRIEAPINVKIDTGSLERVWVDINSRGSYVRRWGSSSDTEEVFNQCSKLLNDSRTLRSEVMDNWTWIPAVGGIVLSVGLLQRNSVLIATGLGCYAVASFMFVSTFFRSPLLFSPSPLSKLPSQTREIWIALAAAMVGAVGVKAVEWLWPAVGP